MCVFHISVDESWTENALMRTERAGFANFHVVLGRHWIAGLPEMFDLCVFVILTTLEALWTEQIGPSVFDESSQHPALALLHSVASHWQ